MAALRGGEFDFINLILGALVDTVKNDPKLQLTATRTSAVWLEFPGREKPDSPFNNIKVRQAVSLALDREALNWAELDGLADYVGNWIPAAWPGAVKRPKPAENVEKAKQLMIEAGFPDGFDAGDLTPLPPYFSVGERVLTQLRRIGIRAKLNQMERGAFIILHYSASPGDAAARIRSYAMKRARPPHPATHSRRRRSPGAGAPRQRDGRPRLLR